VPSGARSACVVSVASAVRCACVPDKHEAFGTSLSLFPFMHCGKRCDRLASDDRGGIILARERENRKGNKGVKKDVCEGT